MAVILELFDNSRHQRSEFSCGKDSLDRYIRQQASQDARNRIARVFIVRETDSLEIMGYYTLSSYAIKLAELERSFAKRLPRYSLLPATLLGRLAVDTRHRGKRLGEFLLTSAFHTVFQHSLQIASLALVVDALDEEAVRFYRKYRFDFCQESPDKLYLPLKTIQEILES